MTVIVKGAKEAPKAESNRMETIIVTLDMIDKWKLPPFQRPLTINKKVIEGVEALKVSEKIEGIVTLGHIRGDLTTTFVVDGQHRVEQFRLSGLEMAYDVSPSKFWGIPCPFRYNSVVYRVIESHVYKGEPYVLIEGHTAHYWRSCRFRPTVKPKADLSIFTSMLTPKRQDVDA